MTKWPVVIWLLMSAACATLEPPRLPAAPLATDRQQPPSRFPSRDGGCGLTGQWGSAPAIRFEDASVRALLVEGCRRSPSLRHLADAIGRTDGIVYIDLHPCRVRALRGCLLHTIKDTGNARYLWIQISANRDVTELTATLAHELQHALEVLRRAEIRSQRDLLDFYRSLDAGASSAASAVGPNRVYETHEAIRIATMVRSELSSAGGVSATAAEVSADDRE